jgi:membrane-bound lytic murein transglycosylase C
VAYKNDLYSINFEKGEVQVYTVIDKALLRNPKALSDTLDVKMSKLEEMLQTQLTEKDNVDILQNQQPTKVKNQSAATEKPAIKDIETVATSDTSKIQIRYTYNLLPEHIRLRSENFIPIIEKYCHRFKVDKHLVMAIIHTESYFNPYALSHANACGLMQIVPHYAGIDVANHFNESKPTQAFLFLPDNNIRYGTKFIQILDSYYAGITDIRKREYCIIAAYNGGQSNVNQLFGNGRQNAIDNINAMTIEEVYAKLTKQHKYAETRNYVSLVSERKKNYQQWMK